MNIKFNLVLPKLTYKESLSDIYLNKNNRIKMTQTDSNSRFRFPYILKE